MEAMKDLQFRGSADITAKGTWPDLAVRGGIRIEDATYAPELELIEILKLLTARRTRALSASKKEPSTVNIALDIDVVSRDSFHLEGSLGEADMGGNFQIKGTLEKPVILGTGSTSRGWLSFLGSKFELTRARVEFADPLVIDPELDIVGTTTKGDEIITIHIEGKASRTQLTLSSDKGRSQADLMTALLGGSGSGGSLTSSATKMALRGAATPLLGALGGRTDLEIVPLPTTAEGENFLFSVATNLSKGVTATYFKGISGETADAIEFRWRLTSRTRGRLRQNQDGTLSGGFRIRREFN
jgi:translocation and assembly module TamB